MSPPLSASSPSALSDLLDKDGVVVRITDLFLATDRKDWAAVEAQLRRAR